MIASVTQQATGSLRWQILLAEMNTIRSKSQRNIHSIVYYNPYPALTGDA